MGPGLWILGSWVQGSGPRSWIHDPGPRPGSWIRILDPGSKALDPGPLMLDPGSGFRIQDWVVHSGSRIIAPGPRILDPGFWAQDP